MSRHLETLKLIMLKRGSLRGRPSGFFQEFKLSDNTNERFYRVTQKDVYP